MSEDKDWSAAGRASVAAHVHNATWRERILEPDREPMTLAKALGWIFCTAVCAGLFLFAWAGTP